MKLKIFLLFSFFITYTFPCQNNVSYIVNILKDINNSLPQLIEEVKNMPACQTSDLKPICSKGYSYWNSVSDAQIFKGVSRDKESLNTFFDIITESLPIEKADEDIIFPLFLTAAQIGSGFTEVFGIDILYNKNAVASADKGCYFSVFMERNCVNKKEFDFFFTGIKTGFKLGKDVFLLEQGGGNFIKGSYEQKVVEVDPNLSRDQYNSLLKLMQVGCYANAMELIDLCNGI